MAINTNKDANKNTDIEVIFFPNGVTAVCDEGGRQMPEIQKSWFIMFVEYLASRGYDPTQIKFYLPHKKVVKVFKTESGGYNYRIEG